MAILNYFFIFIISVLSSNLIECAEFVPVYMWGRHKRSEHVPALHKISQDSYKDTLLEYLKDEPFVILFAERTLSPEDFAQHGPNGDVAFKNIRELKNEKNHVTYKPYVQNPIGAIKQLNKPVTEISIGSLLTSSNVPKDNILIIDLNDAKDDESRFHMLKRHDSDIVSIYKDICGQRDNVLAIYTALHTSWVAPEDITHSRSRSLLQSESTPSPSTWYEQEHFLLYLSAEGKYTTKDAKTISITNATFNSDSTTNMTSTTVTLTSSQLTISFDFNKTQPGYWFVTSIEVKETGTSKDSVVLNGTKDFYAPDHFSYHCGPLTLTGPGGISLSLPGFQVQPFLGNRTFGDAYDCVGFTSIPIWSGLFVTAILLLIITFGLAFIMDIKTMDRFDDPKGKTITVSASE